MSLFWLLPNPLPPLPPGSQVSVTIAATETNSDVAQIGIYVYDQTVPAYTLFAGANVSIEEVPATNGGAASIGEV